jgi:antitoxin (DNA-binding transcriptional repressor) of toxin-antitoxin stability system
MRTMSVGEFKTHFSEVLKSVLAGEEVGIMYGKRKEVVAKLVPKVSGKRAKRKLGPLSGKGRITFADDFKMTQEEFLGS